MSSKMDGIIDKVADAGEKIAPGGAHRGVAAEEHKPGIMDKIADAAEKLVEKFDHSDSTPSPSTPGVATAAHPTPPVEIPEPNQHMDPTGKVV